MENRSLYLALTIAAGLHCCLERTALAQPSSTWINPSGGSWLTSSNWSSGVPNASGARAFISTQPSSFGDFILNGPMTLGLLDYSNSGHRELVGSGTLSMQAPSGNARIAVSQGSLELRVAGVVLQSTTEFNITTPSATFASVDVFSPISGPGGLTKTGARRLELHGSNTYAGPTLINEGFLALASSERLPSGTAVIVNSGGTLELRRDNVETIGSLSGSGNVVMGTLGGFGTGRLQIAGNASTTFSGVISGVGGLTKGGSGTLTLSGENTYIGSTLLAGGSGGALAIGRDNALPVSTSLTINSGHTLALNGFNQTVGSLAGFGNVTLGSGTLSVGGSQTYFGVISGSGGLTKIGSGTVALNGANTYTGATTIEGGTLRMGGANRLSGVTALTVNNGAFNLNNFNQTVGSLAGFGNVVLGSATLTIGGNAQSTTFGGVVSGAGGLTKIGGGTLTLSGTSSYAGPTSIAAGTLQIAGGGSIITGGPLNIAQPGTLRLQSGGMVSATGTLTNAGLIEIATGGLVAAAALNNTGTLAGSGHVEALVTIAGGGILAPGNSPGTMTGSDFVFGPGGVFQFEINDALGTAGFDPGWDLLSLSGTLNITATADAPFVVDIVSLALDNTSGEVFNFDHTQDYSWEFVRAGGGISGFSESVFALVWDSFLNDLGGGLFSISQVDDSLFVNFTSAAGAVVPEPSSLALLGLGAVSLFGAHLRRRRRCARP